MHAKKLAHMSSIDVLRGFGSSNLHLDASAAHVVVVVVVVSSCVRVCVCVR
jgi:hypothetical protein